LTAAERVESFADVDRGDVLDELEFAGVDIDFYLGGAGGEKPKRRSAFLAEFVFRQGLYLPFATSVPPCMPKRLNITSA